MILVYLESVKIEYDVTISKKAVGDKYGDAFAICYEGISPAEVFEQIVNHFESENND